MIQAELDRLPANTERTHQSAPYAKTVLVCTYAHVGRI